MDIVIQEPSHLGKSYRKFVDMEERHKSINYMLRKTRLWSRSEFCFSASSWIWLDLLWGIPTWFCKLLILFCFL